MIFPTVRIPVLRISYSDLFIILAVAAWFVNFSLNKSKDGWGVPLHILWFPSILILFGGLISSIGALTPVTSVEITIKTIFVLTIWISMGIVMVRQGNLNRVIAVFLAAVCLTAGIAVFDRWVGTRIGDAISGNIVLFYFRSASTMGHPNELGFITSVGVPLALGLLMREWASQRRISLVALLAGAFVLNILALFYSGSVAAWVSAVVSIGIFSIIWFLRATRVQRWGIAAGLGLFLLAGAIFLSSPGRLAQTQALVDFNLNRVVTITGPGRAFLMLKAFNVIAASPIVGVGLDQTGTGNLQKKVLVTSDWIHNTLIGGWLGGGIFVFLGLALAYLVVFVVSIRALLWGFRTQDWLAVGLGACAIGWILFDQTQPSLYHRFTWLTVAWMFALGFNIRCFADSSPSATEKSPMETWQSSSPLVPPVTTK